MKQLTLLDKYILDWKCFSESGFICEISHFYKTSEVGRLLTPVGFVFGFSNSHPKHWNIKVILRNNVYYSSQENKILVVVESAYGNKQQYLLDYQKLKAHKHLPIDTNFKSEFIKYLIEENICTEPLYLEVGLESIEEYEQVGDLSLDDFD